MLTVTALVSWGDRVSLLRRVSGGYLAQLEAEGWLVWETWTEEPGLATLLARMKELRPLLTET